MNPNIESFFVYIILKYTIMFHIPNLMEWLILEYHIHIRLWKNFQAELATA